MGLMNPIWLWGLAGLMIPVAIHLLSRKDMRVIQVGSLRHLVNSTTRQAIRIRLNEYLLLALRCLLIALLTLLLAELYVRRTKNTTRWLVVESGLDQTLQWKHFVDSLVRDGYELRRLQQGFPPANAADAVQAIPDYWSLAQQLTRIQPERCFVISRDRAVGFAGERVSIGNNITWLTSSTDSSRFVIVVNRSLPDTIVARVGRSNEFRTIYESLKAPAAQEHALLQEWSQPERKVSNGSSPETAAPIPYSVNTVRIAISGTQVIEEERRIVEAALQAISVDAIVPIQYQFIEPGSPPEGDWLIWLSPDEPPVNNINRIIQKAGPNTSTDLKSAWPLLHQARMDQATAGSTPVLPESPQSKSRWWITRPLTLSAAVREQFTLQLATILLHDVNRRLLQTARSFDHRVMPDAEKFSSAGIMSNDGGNNGQKTASTTQREGSGILAVVLVLLFICERFIASRQQL